ncbi:MAG: hypothetical protein ABIH03_12775 [Pseudomonadota bacterium]
MADSRLRKGDIDAEETGIENALDENMGTADAQADDEKELARSIADKAKSGRQAKREADPARESRAMEDRAVTESRILSDDERLEMFRAQFIQAALPDPPPIAGYHAIWLSTTNPRDTIHNRQQLGYELVRADEVPGWMSASIKTGEYAGCIGVNEMLLAKLPLRLYEMYMQELHYDLPNREQEKLVAAVDALHESAAGDKTTIDEGDGYKELRKAAPKRPTFISEKERLGAGHTQI